MSSPDVIRLDGLSLQCIVGILPAERLRAQPLQLAVELECDATGAALSGDLDASIDYAKAAEASLFLLRAGRFKLLETAGLALCHYLLTAPVGKELAATAARVTLSKPEALSGVGVPSVSLRRTAAQVHSRQEAQGTLLRIFRSSEVEVIRLAGWDDQVALPGASRYRQRDELALSATDRLIVLTM